MEKEQEKTKKGHVDIPTPKVFRRGKKGTYYFRIRAGGRDKWLSTSTSNSKEAKKIARTAVEAKHSSKFTAAPGKNMDSVARNIADAVVANVTGVAKERIPISSGLDWWIKLTPSHSDLTKTTCNFYSSVYKQFSSWCKTREIKHIDQVSSGHSREYAKKLLESHLTPKTYNEHIKFLSRIFSTLDSVYSLPHRDPFGKRIIIRKGKSELKTVSHRALEPKMLEKVLKKSGEYGRDYRDLFVLGSHTGMRLKDACLLEWKNIGVSFIDIEPYKTKKTGNTARIPISSTLQKMLDERKKDGDSVYVIPGIAERYLKDSHHISVKATKIFEEALGEEVIRVGKGTHRLKNTPVFSFHSFRTGFVSLLASEDVSIRDAMRMMGWLSPEMMRIYEKELEKAKAGADKRATELVKKINEFNIQLPSYKTKLVPEAAALRDLVNKYSNITVGRIYGITETAIRKQLKKFGIRRTKRIESAKITDKEIEKIRNNLGKQ